MPSDESVRVPSKSNKIYLNLFSIYCNFVLLIEFFAYAEAVAPFALRDISRKVGRVASAVPRLNADKWRVFPRGRPNTEKGRGEFYRQILVFSVKKRNLIDAAVFDYERVIVEKRLGEQNVAGNSVALGSIKSLGIDKIIEKSLSVFHSKNGFSLFNAERGMRAD